MPAAKAFENRLEAGRLLAERLAPMAPERPVVIGLPRGGVPVAREVASTLDAPLDFLAVRKLGAPHNPEYGIGAIAEDGSHIVDIEAISILGISSPDIDAIISREVGELRRRISAYRDDRPQVELADRTVIVVDDGVATGLTDTAALCSIRRRHPRRLVLAVPVCAPEAMERLRKEADEVICLLLPSSLHGVGQWYRDFSQVTDEEVIAALREADDVPAR